MVDGIVVRELDGVLPRDDEDPRGEALGLLGHLERLARTAVAARPLDPDDRVGGVRPRRAALDENDPSGNGARSALGARAEMLTPAEAQERWSGIRFDTRVLHCPDGGRLDAEGAVAALQAQAARHGAEVLLETPVDAIRVRTDGRVEVTTSDEVFVADTVVVTTVHDLQLVAGAIPMTSHDLPVDVVVTPTRIVRCRGDFERPRGIEWDALSPAQLDAMPAVAGLRRIATRK